ncbi:MAG TPA: hypothetical protein DCX27_11485 [Balneola sp.]|nr:hypothetical protein [Balneola sp.]|tara:strand:+ start:328 stop:1194 length:867 start_codon:yes stop_codon:yes gene_type:complete
MIYSLNTIISDVKEQGLLIMADTIILDVPTSGSSISYGCNNSYLLYDNKLNLNSSRTTPEESSQSAGYLSLYDGNSNLKFISSSSGSLDFDFEFSTAQKINSMSCAGANLFDAGVVWEFYTFDIDNATYIKQHDGSGKNNNSPIFGIFETVTTSKIRFRFITTTPIMIGELGCGLALRFPVPPSIGWQPARWNSNNQINIGRTEANTTASSTVIERGAPESVKFDNLEASWMDSNFIDVLEFQGLPVWFVGDSRYNPNDCIFGNWSASNSSYESAYRTSLSLKFNGAK